MTDWPHLTSDCSNTSAKFASTTRSREGDNLVTSIAKHKRPWSNNSNTRYLSPATNVLLPVTGPRKQTKKEVKRLKLEFLRKHQKKKNSNHSMLLNYKKHPKRELLRLNSQLTRKVTNQLIYCKPFAMLSVIVIWVLSSQQKEILCWWALLETKRPLYYTEVIECQDDATVECEIKFLRNGRIDAMTDYPIFMFEIGINASFPKATKLRFSDFLKLWIMGCCRGFCMLSCWVPTAILTPRTNIFSNYKCNVESTNVDLRWIIVFESNWIK